MAITITNNTTLLNELKTKAESLPNKEIAGVDVSGVTATASDVLSPKVFVDSTGVEQTGTIVTKTANDLTAKTNTVTVPAGYYATQVSKSISTGTVNKPIFNVNASGLITATVSTSAGYVTNVSKQNTYQLPTQAAEIVTPSTTQQTAVASGKYTTGNVYVAGDSNLVADNIKKGVSIFGVSGSYEGASSGSNDKVKVFSGTASPYSKSTLGISLNENVSGYSLKMAAVAMTKSDANASLNGVISYSRFPESAQSIAVCGVYGNSYDEFLIYGGASFEESVTNTTFVLSISSTNSYRMFNTGAQYNYLLVYKLNEIEVV